MAGGDLVEMARMACVQANATAAGLTRTDAGRADHDEDRHAGVRAQAVERLVAWIVGGHVEPRARHAEADHARGGAQTAVELFDGGAAVARVDVEPVAEDDLGMLALGREGVVVQRARLVDGRRQAHAEIEHDPYARLAEVLRHLGLADVARLGFEDALLLRQLLGRLERVPAPRAPVRMHVDDRRHRACARRSSTCRVKAWR